MMAMGNDEVMITKRVTLYEATSFLHDFGIEMHTGA
jgi:hypothetical protein